MAPSFDPCVCQGRLFGVWCVKTCQEAKIWEVLPIIVLVLPQNQGILTQF